MTTYTPGYSGIKLVILLMGVLLFFIGLWQIAPPVWALLTGFEEKGVIVQIDRLKNGTVTPYRVAVDLPVDPDAQSIYSYWVRLGKDNTRKYQLNIYHDSMPGYRLGDNIRVLFPEKTSSTLYVPGDLQTWAAGVLLITFGLAFTASFYLIWARSTIPIALPEDTPIALVD